MSNKSSPFVQLLLDFDGHFPDSFTLPADSLITSPFRGSGGLRSDGLRSIRFLCISRGKGFRRYLSSDGFPWTLWLRTLRLERGCICTNDSPMLRSDCRNAKLYLRMMHRGRKYYIHRLIAQYFLNGGEPIPPGLEVDHLDGNTRNNAVSNLEIVTREENNRRRNVRLGWKPLPDHLRRYSRDAHRRRRARLRAQQHPTA